MVSGVLSRRELVRTVVHTLDVVWLLLADSIGFEMPKLDNLTWRERRAHRSGGNGDGGTATEEGKEEGCADSSFYRHEVIDYIKH